VERRHWCKDITSATFLARIVQDADTVGLTRRDGRKARARRAAGILETAAAGSMKVYESADFSDPGGSRKTAAGETLVNVE
jgi:hypothetical protein